MKHPKPLKRFSQVFLKDSSTLKQIASYAIELEPLNILEIGPGPGTLTEYLLHSKIPVLAIEKDKRLVTHLKQNFNHSDQLKIEEGDILNFDLDSWSSKNPNSSVIGNIPYQISTPILKWLLPHISKIRAAYLLVQKEFGQRLASPINSKSYGSLSVYTQLRSNVETILDVPRSKFDPIPNVDSILIKVSKSNFSYNKNILHLCETLTQAAFNQRRKKLSNSLKALFNQYQINFDQVSADFNKRPEDLNPIEFYRLAEEVSKIRVSK